MGATGTTQIDFGAFPGASDASVAVTGQASILGSSMVEAWLMPADTTDHTADEHWVETIKVMAGAPTAGVGFTIYAVNTNQINEPITPIGSSNSTTLTGQLQQAQGFQQPTAGGNGTRLYGKWNVGWVWV